MQNPITEPSMPFMKKKRNCLTNMWIWKLACCLLFGSQNWILSNFFTNTIQYCALREHWKNIHCRNACITWQTVETISTYYSISGQIRLHLGWNILNHEFNYLKRRHRLCHVQTIVPTLFPMLCEKWKRGYDTLFTFSSMSRLNVPQ